MATILHFKFLTIITAYFPWELSHISPEKHCHSFCLTSVFFPELHQNALIPLKKTSWNNRMLFAFVQQA